MAKLLKKIGKGLGKALGNKWVKGAVAAGLAATGVGVPAAAAIMAAQGAASKGLQGAKLGTIAKGGLRGGVEGAASAVGGKVLRNVGGKVFGKVAEPVGEKLVSTSGMPGMTPLRAGVGGVPESLFNPAKKGLVARGKDFIGDALKNKMKQKVLGSADAGGGRGGMSLVDKLLMGGTVAAGTEDAIRRRQMQNQARNYATQSYDARAPIRARALALMQDESKPNLAPLFSDPGNPYDRQRRAAIAAGG